MKYIDRSDVERRLTYDVCMPIVREAMIALSRGATRQLPRAIMPLAHDNKFGVMTGSLGGNAAFGCKVVSVYPGNFAKGLPSHQGLVLLFEPASGAPVCVVDGGAITAIRTAAASAVATDALARDDAATLALLGYGEQAANHARAIAQVRELHRITVWGRSSERAHAFAKRMGGELKIPVMPYESAQDAVGEADIICTVSGAPEPILKGAWVRPGTHINVVGSSVAGPAEIDNDLVAKARFVADSRENVLQQGAEFLRAKKAGVVNDSHIFAEIGQILGGDIAGRRDDEEITLYKSLGHIVQDLAAAWAVFNAVG